MRLGPTALTRAVVEFECPKGHVQKLPASDVAEIADDFRVLTFAQNVECPTCWEDPGAFAPAFSHVVGIEWEPPES